MDAKEIEEKALNALKFYLEDSHVISYYLDDNDKEPSWDGHLYLYQDGIRDKQHLIGRIPVQVKGQMVANFKIQDFKYKIEVTDLKAYKEEPTIFIVCQEKEDSKERILYYKELLPETIKHILKGKEQQKTISVPFKKFPDNIEDFEDILKVFYHNALRQLSFITSPAFTIKDAKKKGIKKFTFCTPKQYQDQHELYQYLSRTPTFLYASLDEPVRIEIPVANGPYKFIFQTNKKMDVKVGDRIFYDNITTSIINGDDNIIIDDFCSLTFSRSNPELSKLCCVADKKNLSRYMYQIEFMRALSREKKIVLGTLELNLGDGEIAKEKELKEDYESCIKLKQLLNRLHIKKELNLSLIKEKEGYWLELLVSSLVEQKPIRLTKQLETDVVKFRFGNIQVLIICLKNEDGTNSFEDFFNNDLRLSFEYKDGTVIEDAVPYSYLAEKEENLWVSIDNIEWERIIDVYKEKAEKNPIIYQIAEHDAKCMMSAYQKTKETDKNKSLLLLSIAEKLMEFYSGKTQI